MTTEAKQVAHTPGIDWYERRDELEEGQVFRLRDGDVVKLDRRVAGDGTKWFVANWSDYGTYFAYEDGTIEPGDLMERLPDNYAEAARAARSKAGAA